MATKSEIWRASYQFGTRMDHNLPMSEVEKCWLRFMDTRPDMLGHLTSLTQEMVARGITGQGAKMLLGKLKWDYAMRNDSTSVSMNDHLLPYCARYLNYKVGSKDTLPFRLKINSEERPMMRLVSHSPEFDRAVWIERMTPLQQNFVRFM